MGFFLNSFDLVMGREFEWELRKCVFKMFYELGCGCGCKEILDGGFFGIVGDEGWGDRESNVFISFWVKFMR